MPSHEQLWHTITSGEHPTPTIRLARGGLSLLAAVYCAGVRAYRLTYDLGLVRVERLPVPVIGVGNLTLGGTGKTTAVRWLAGEVRRLGKLPAILSRGYGARHGQAVAVVADRDGIRLPAEESGDEPQLLARALPGVPVVVGKNRRVTGRLAVAEHGAEVCILDDSFQYWRLAKDLEIVLVNAARPLSEERLFPRGHLREPPAALRRADGAILTHADRAREADRTALRDFLRHHHPALAIAEARHRPAGFRALGGSDVAETEDLRRERWLAVASLGDPTSFPATLVSLGLEAVGVPFPDHHAYAEPELSSLAARARGEGFAGTLTTEKDAVKLRPEWFGGLPCWVLSVELEFMAGGEAIESLVRRCVGGEA